MAYENKCMYCFEDLNGHDVCPHCGRDSRAAVPQIQLLPGTMLHNGRFLVGRAMGQDASGIVYMAYDTKREATLRIREYLPRDSARRLNDGSVVPVAGAEDAFEKGMQRLKASVEAVEDPKKRHFYFEENGTAYIAQRKSATHASASGAGAEEESEGRSTRQWALIIGGAAVAVLVVAFVLIRLLSSAFDTTTTPTSMPTLASDSLWTPAVTPSPTPYVQTTFAPITDPDLSWMDYISGTDENQNYQNQAGNVRTPTPAPNATPRPTSQVISGNSSTEEITSLQWQLIALGWLDASQPTGVYDSATRQAVRDFQTYMNETYAIDPKLTVDGIAGPQTLYWLDQSSIAAKPTQSPATLPPVVTEAPEDDFLIDENSSSSDIRRVQQLLITLGQLPAGSDDGIYGAATRGAVWEFQSFVNSYYGRQVLEVTGEVDSATRDYLIVFADWWESTRPTATATVAPTTAAPTPTATATVAPTPTAESGIGPNSSTERIRYLQTMLRDLGFLNGVDGVYGSATSIAVRDFQVWANEQQGYNALTVSGNCDAATLSLLEYYVDHPVTPAPTTQAPTQAPATTQPATQPPAGDEDDNVLVDANSDPESIRYMQEQLVYLGYLDSADGVFGSATTQAIINFQQQVNADLGYEALTPNGVFNARTQNYLEEYVYRAQLATQTPTVAPTPTPGAVGEPQITFEGASGESEGITLTQGDLGVHWTAEGAAEYHILFTDESGATVYEHTYAGDSTGMTIPANILTANVVYELSVTAVPAGGGEGSTALAWVMLVRAQATESPISAPQIGATASGYDDGGVYVFDTAAAFSWSVDGEVGGYTVTLYDAQGGVVNTGSVSGNSLDLSSFNLTPGMDYTLEVVAHPASGGEDTASTVTFRIAEPEITEAPTPSPTPTPAPISAPQIGATASGYDDGGVYVFDTAAAFSWSVDGEVGGYTVTLYDAQGGVVNTGSVSGNSLDLSSFNLTPGMDYTLEVVAHPASGGEDTASTVTFRIAASEATETPAPSMPATIDRNSDSASIENMQEQLFALGMFTSENAPERGVFDQRTLEAVLRFQQQYNAQNPGAPLIEIDPTNPDTVIDATTLAVLMSATVPMG